jgi:hypothetical protein
MKFLQGWLFKGRFDSIAFLFLLFLFCVLSFGRTFSIIQVMQIGNVPVFVTELFLFLMLPVLWLNRKRVLELPKVYFITSLIFFILGWIYLLVGLSFHNLFVLRDIVLFLYMLFCPIAFISINKSNKIALFLLVLVLSNVIGLLMGRFMLWDAYPSSPFYVFISATKIFNLGLYYGIAASILIALSGSIRSPIIKYAVLMIIALNMYMILVFSVRTIWLACIALFVYSILTLKKEFIKFIIRFIPVFIIISTVFGFMDFIVCKSPQLEQVLIKGKSTYLFLCGKEESEGQKLGIKENTKEYNVLSQKEFEKVKRSGQGNIKWRLRVWHEFITFGLKSPVLGRGFGNYPCFKLNGFTMPKRVGVNSKIVPPHNHFVTIFYKMGLLGLSIFVFISVYTFYYGLRYINKCKTDFRKRVLIGALGALLFWHVSALFFDVIDSPPTSIFLWMLTGLIFSTVDIDKKADSEGAIKAQ